MTSGYSYLGVDSAAYADQMSNSWTGTLAYYCSQYFANFYEGQFWGRYFGPTDGTFNSMSSTAHESDVPNEVAVMQNYNPGQWIFCIASPGYNKFKSNTYSVGYADGQAAATGINNVMSWAPALGFGSDLPGALLNVYVDVEAGANGGYNFNYTQYWRGWYDGLQSVESHGVYPFVACAYCTPGSSDGVCGQLTSDSAHYVHNVWTTQPDYSCSNSSPYQCQMNPSLTWGQQTNCASVYTELWQYSIWGPNTCTLCYSQSFPQVDLDISTSGEDVHPYMLRNLPPPTAAHVVHFTATRRGHTIRFRWRLADATGVVGFHLFAGRLRLNRHVIPTHDSRQYQAIKRYHPGPVRLQVLLDDGQTLMVSA